MNEPKPIDLKKYEGRDSIQISNSVDEKMHYNDDEYPTREDVVRNWIKDNDPPAPPSKLFIFTTEEILQIYEDKYGRRLMGVISRLEKELEAANQHVKIVNAIDVERVNAMDIVGQLTHPLTVVPRRFGDPEQNLSRKVVVDLNGNRQYFVIGWYDFDDEDWTFDHNDISMLEREHAKWMDILPID